MTTTNKQKVLIALGTVAVLGGTVVGVQAYQHDAKCKVHESEMLVHLEQMNLILDDAEGMLDTLAVNPLAAFGMIGQLTGLQSEMKQIERDSEKNVKEYVKVCGEKRHQRYVASDTFQDVAEPVLERAERLQSNAQGLVDQWSF